MEVGFIGLGAMGAGIAANLVRGGHRVKVWNRSPAPMDALAGQGATKAASPAEAAQAEILISMLADDAAVRQTILDGGVLRAPSPGVVHVNMATVSVETARDLARLHAEAGVGYVAAPVLGRPDVAAAGKLNILTAGPPDLIARVQPLLELMGSRIWRFGDRAEQANAAKLAANFMIASAIEAMAEAATLAEGHEVPTAAFLDMVTSTLFAAPVYKIYGEAIAQRRFEPPGFKLTLGLKDVRLALEAADRTHVPMPFASVLKDNFLDAVANGDGGRDWAALANVAARRAGRR
ncbi:MAG: NAD(P)-dependent oxidoreductase [Acetobacteraceae bacterium]|nr:NAD(P)-dependent oxidoreductase [Acetobacteraceae bacterium]